MNTQRQPRQIVPIDASHPLARDLRFFIAFVGATPVDLVSGAIATPSGAPSVEPFGSVTAAKLDASGSDYYEWVDSDRHDITGEITLAWRGTIASGSAFRHFAGKHASGGGTDNPFDFRTSNSANPEVALVRANASSFGNYVSNAAFTPSSTVVRTVEVTQGATLNLTPSMYLDGVASSVTVFTTGPSTAATGNANGLRVGRRTDGAVQQDGYTEYVVGWARVLSADELAQFRADPWALLQQFDDAWEDVAVAAAGVTIAGSVGNAVAAGATATVSSPIAVSGSVGNAVAAGSTAGVASPLTLAGSVGNAVAAGATATVSSPISVAGSVGNAVAAGAAASISAGSSVTVDGSVGNAVAAGASASITSPVTLSCSAGSAVADGVDCSVGVGGAISIDCGVGGALAAGVDCSVWSADVLLPRSRRIGPESLRPGHDDVVARVPERRIGASVLRRPS